MEQYEQQLLEALRASLRGQDAAAALRGEEAWRRLWELAAQQKVLSLAADALASRRPGDGGVCLPPAVRQAAARTAAVQFRRSRRFMELYREMEAAGAQPLAVKGIVCRQLYPKPDLRISADEDLLVREGDLKAVLTVLRRAGMTPERPDAEQVIACRDPETGLYLELHRTLFPEQSEAYGTLNRFFCGAFEKKTELSAEGGRVFTLCPEEHLLYLILHSFKHFLHSGFGIRQVCDICLFASAYGDAVDWAALAARLREARAEVFAANLLAIGREHLGFAAYPPGVEQWLQGYASQLDCGDLLADLLSGGIYGSSTEARCHSSLITLNAVVENTSAHGARRVLRTVFPPERDLAGAYPYLARHPWLLPIAWLQRIGHYRLRNRRDSVRESLDIGKRRVQLLKKYHVIE